MKTQIILTAALTLASSIALAGGAGYNGPVTAGEALPIQLDRAISLDRLTHTLEFCASDLVKDLIRQLTRLTPSEFDKKYAYTDWLTSRTTKRWRFTDRKDAYAYQFDMEWYGGYKSSDYDQYLVTMVHDLSYSSSKDAGAYEQSYLRGIELHTPSETAKFIDLRIPGVKFDAAFKEAVYSQLGTLDSSTLKLSGLKLLIPDTYADRVPLVHSESGKHIEVEANLKSYVDCFFNEISK